jgi:protein farnesyltransferase subunit beta
MNFYKDEDSHNPTYTSQLQKETVQSVLENYTGTTELFRDKHLQYLIKALDSPLSKYFVALDGSKPWILYWIFHSLSLLNYSIPDHYVDA